MGEDRRQSNTTAIPRPASAARPLRIGITGHTDLGGRTLELVADALSGYLRSQRATPFDRSPLIGVSCLAPGTDCVFADLVLRLGGSLEVILPSADYFEAQVADRYELVFDDLLRRAGSVRTAGWAKAGPWAYAAANDLMLDSVDRLVAVWNGVASDEPGGTSHMVSEARARRIPVTVIWPEGSRRG